MSKRIWLAGAGVAVAAITVLVACGDKGGKSNDASAKVGTDGAKPEPAAVEPAKPAGLTEEERARLQTQLAEARARVDALEGSLEKMQERHQQERADLPPPSELNDMRRSIVATKKNAIAEAANVKRIQARLEELQKVAESQVTGKLKEQREALAQLEKQRDAVRNAFLEEMRAVELGKTEAAPALRHLHVLREIKNEWFKATGEARAGALDSGGKKRVSDSFRSWVKGDAERKALVDTVLAHDAAKGQSVDAYDFSALEFFLLMQFREDTLTRENIARERKILSENKDKLDALEIDIEKLEATISATMHEGGDELVEYETMQNLIGNAIEDAEYLSTRYATLKEQMDAITNVSERQSEEESALRADLEAAEQAMRDLRKKLES